MAMSKEKAARFREAMAAQIGKNASTIEEREAKIEEEKKDLFEKVSEAVAQGTQKMFSELFFDPAEVGKPDFPVDTFWDKHAGWPDWVVEAVPVRDVNYQWNKPAVYAFVVSDDEYAFLVGLPGSGKTTLPEQVAAITGRPCFVQSFSNDLEADEWLMSKEIDDTGTHWTTLPFVRWLEYPCYATLDEFNRLRRGGRLLMNRLLNDGGSMQLRDGREITPHAQWRAVATDNTRGMGDGLDKFDGDIADISTTDRFATMIEVEYLPQDQQIKLMMSWYPEMAEEMARDIVQFGEKVVTGYKSGTFPLPWTPRRMKKAGKLALRMRDPVAGLKNAYYNFLAEDRERGAANQILKDIGLARKFGEFS